MLRRLGTLAKAAGVEAITIHWPLETWDAAAPERDPRWKMLALKGSSVFLTGVGHTHHEALYELLSKFEARLAVHG